MTSQASVLRTGGGDAGLVAFRAPLPANPYLSLRPLRGGPVNAADCAGGEKELRRLSGGHHRGGRMTRKRDPWRLPRLAFA
jgi:hypothetical protein